MQNESLRKKVSFLQSLLKEIGCKRRTKHGVVTHKTPIPVTAEEYQAQFKTEDAQEEAHRMIAARNHSAKGFAAQFFAFIGETAATLKRKGVKAMQYRALRNTILSRISKLYEEHGTLTHEEVEERLYAWGDSSYKVLFLGPPGTGKT
ncbi:hypothetical protein BTZ05_25650, partial [Vibrio parahaemolyticus]|uniref:hypothetical protein n=1 Tax=Vibrio parahaemolyticus TaxID=670 RepID=UPI000B751C77